MEGTRRSRGGENYNQVILYEKKYILIKGEYF